ncbi:MAG: COQ9 family protein [Silicimonas sp.]|nr:COQ9 family protein [Silicimonas sp.]NNL73668.1 COQ9 family protein [Silicimonas sp.]RZW00831.1 MAG: COQ9 family protein [Paracoccaceae bacterium]
MADTASPTIDTLLDAALAHVPFEGWSPTTFRAAVRDTGVDEAGARALAPRGALDLAVAYHRRGDQAMIERMRNTDLSGLRFSEKVAKALQFRVEAMEDREVVRRATALFSLPIHAAEGAKLIWETADHVWTALGDTSEDMNWYTKRATLSGVWGATVLYWLGDDSPGHANTVAFIDRRIEDVMRIEKVKGKLRENPLTKPLMELQAGLFKRVRMPDATHLRDLPGRWQGPR